MRDERSLTVKGETIDLAINLQPYNKRLRTILMDSDKTVKIIFFLLFNFFLLLLFFTFPRVRCNPARHWGRTEQSKHKLFAAAANTHTHTHNKGARCALRLLFLGREEICYLHYRAEIVPLLPDGLVVVIGGGKEKGGKRDPSTFSLRLICFISDRLKVTRATGFWTRENPENIKSREKGEENKTKNNSS